MTQGELEKIPLPFQNILSDLESRVMSEIVRAIKINGFSTSTADWQMQRLIQMGKSEKEIKKRVQEALELSDAELEQVYSEDVYKQYYKYERIYKASGKEQIPFEKNKELQMLIKAAKRQTKETFRNMTNSLGFAIRNPATGEIQYSPLMEFYQSTLTNAVMDISSGAISYDKALSHAINTMTNSGLRWVDYESGWHNRVDVAARRAVMTGFRQVRGKINEQVAEELGTDSYEVTYHVGARPSHQPWQGRIWTHEQLVSVCGLGSVTGLHGANCYHDYNPFIPGVSVRTYTDEQLDQMMAEENTPKEYNGKSYTTYEALQEQRRQETAMRKTRQDIKLLKEGDASKDAITLKKARYQLQQQQYKVFSKAMGLPEQKQRVYQDGLGNISRKANKSVVKVSDSGIIKPKKVSTGGRRNEVPLTKDEIRKYADYARKMGFKSDISYSEYSNTAFVGSVEGDRYCRLVIGTDVKPSLHPRSVNDRISPKAAIAHEIIGHYEAWEGEFELSNTALDEAQASIRAARFAPNLTFSERSDLIRDALTRLKNGNIPLNEARQYMRIERR